MKNMFIAIVVVVMLFGCSGNQSTFDVDYKKDSPTINNNITIVTNAELKKAQSNIFRAQFNNDRENVSSVNTHQEEVKYDRDTTGNIISSIHTSVVSIEEPFVIRENFKNGRYLLEKGKLRNFMEAIVMYMIKIDEIMKSKQSKDYEMDIHVLGTADGSFSRVIYNGDYGKNRLN